MDSSWIVARQGRSGRGLGRVFDARSCSGRHDTRWLWNARVSKRCRQSSCRLARSGDRVSSGSMLPPSWFVEYSLLNYLFCLSYQIRGHNRAAGSQLTCSHAMRPLPALGLATEPNRVSQPCQLGMYPRAVERSAGLPTGLVENSISTVPSGDTFARGHRTAESMNPLVGYTQLTSFHTHQHRSNPSRTPALPKNMHTPDFPTR